MKFTFRYYLLFLLSLVFTESAVAQETGNRNDTASPPTILWKITGKDCPKPSYLLGTLHLADAEWLYSYPEIKKVIDSTEFILTEAYSSEPIVTPVIKSKLKAIPLLTKEQYQTLDSFFVARVGEGIRNNAEAESMTVAEMQNAIVSTIYSDSKNIRDGRKLMDADLFMLYRKLSRKGDRLDRVAQVEFDSTGIEHAKQNITRALGYIRNSDKPDWNTYQATGVSEQIDRYKKMKFDYKFNESPEEAGASEDFDFVPVKKRNQNWMAKITANIASKPCLIAVGLGHLCYQTGVISLLRQRGYIVEPVLFSKAD